MKVLISGISGFVGAHLANTLKNRYEIIGISGPGKNNAVDGIEVYGTNELDRITSEPEVVVMCHAAVSSGNTQIDTVKLFEANVLFTQQLTKRFPNSYHIYTSSVSIYGNSPGKLNEDSLVNPSSEYATSKLWGEKIAGSSGNCGIIRFSSLYGEKMKENTIIPRYVNQALQNGKIEIWGKGERRQNYFSVKDVIHYIQKMIEIRPEGIYLGVSAKEISNLELAGMIASYTNAELVFKGEDASFSLAFNNEKTRNKLNISTEAELLTEIKEYIDWKKAQF